MGLSGDIHGSRAPGTTNAHVSPPSHNIPTSFLIASEDTINKASKAALPRSSPSMFGTESPKVTGCDSSCHDNNGNTDGDVQVLDGRDGRRRSTLKPLISARHRDSSLESNELLLSDGRATEGSPPDPSYRRASPLSTSESLASISQTSLLQGLSLASSPKSTSTHSFRPSDDESMDEVSSQAVVSSGDDENEPSSEILDSSPQLIMPSIRMPSRRPFTEKGKGIGLLKILIAGDSGVGKTSLIKSIVQACEDIVHVDPLTPNFPSVDHFRPQKLKRGREKGMISSTDQITEVYASTRPYPSWWTEIEESKMLRRRKSMGDTVLERNLCFVDTPGYTNTGYVAEGIGSVVDYVETQINKISSVSNASYGELVNLMSGRGGTQVDLVFYMILKEIKPADLDFIRKLSAFTNVIPLIAKADLMSPEAARALKQSIKDELNAADIRPPPFTRDESTTSPPYTVSSISADDDENMEASLLMSPDYVKPLLASELSILVRRVFHGEEIRWLKHLAAKKAVDSRRGAVSRSSPIQFSHSPIKSHIFPSQSSIEPRSFFSSPSSSREIVSYPNAGNSYFHAMTADHTQREERFAQIKLAKWAGELQRCLQNERARYEALSRGERAVWLTERLGECVKDGSLVAVDGALTVKPPRQDDTTTKTRLTQPTVSRGVLNPRDPLGLIKWNDILTRRGWIALQVVGGFGVLGAMALWMARSWGAGADAYSTWSCAFWNGNYRCLRNS